MNGRVEAWRTRLAEAVRDRGRKTALATWLADGDPARVHTQQVQLGRVLNRGAGFSSEFLLACEEWMANQPTVRPGRRRTPK